MEKTTIILSCLLLAYVILIIIDLRIGFFKRTIRKIHYKIGLETYDMYSIIAPNKIWMELIVNILKWSILIALFFYSWKIALICLIVPFLLYIILPEQDDYKNLLKMRKYLHGKKDKASVTMDNIIKDLLKLEFEIGNDAQSSNAIDLWDEDTPVLAMWVSSCANNMLTNEINYLNSIKKSSALNKDKIGDYSLERISLIVAFLRENKIEMKQGWEKMWLKNTTSHLETSNHITNDNIGNLISERINFYSAELDVLNISLFPYPNQIITQLYEPMVIGELSHNISTKNIFTDEQNMILWNIIKEELYKFKEKVDSNKDIIYITKKDNK